ncbi:hypothetical protein RND81_02G199500 [Saponaria officinalis]|uniref:Secreted protein n=1 Tax=Saponaria officinalis TaxID=3572 RepID=A0AAW1MMX8_SAPOF
MEGVLNMKTLWFNLLVHASFVITMIGIETEEESNRKQTKSSQGIVECATLLSIDDNHNRIINKRNSNSVHFSKNYYSLHFNQLAP